MTTEFFRKNTFPFPWGRVREGLAFLFLLLWPFALFAQNGVTVSNLVMDAGTVTFEVSWNKSAMPVAVWSDSVWVFVDYNDAGVMKRLPLSSGATLTQTSAPGFSRVDTVAGNSKGVWVAGLTHLISDKLYQIPVVPSCFEPFASYPDLCRFVIF
jgi:hypothetical protein